MTVLRLGPAALCLLYVISLVVVLTVSGSESNCTPPEPWFRRTENRSSEPPPTPTTPPAATPIPSTTTATPSSTPSPAPSQSQSCSNMTLDPYGSCCPSGKVPADNGCCKATCPVAGECLVEINPELGIAPGYPSGGACNQNQQVCDDVWGDPHIVQKDFRWDPMWYGWMLLTQCDGLRVFSHGRQYQYIPDEAVTSQDKILIMYRSTVIEIIHKDWEVPGAHTYLVVRGMDAASAIQSTGSNNVTRQLREIPLSEQVPSIQIGEGASLVTVTRVKSWIVQVCTASGDTFKVTMRYAVSLDLWVCLAPTCNYRASGLLGIHGAPKDQRYTLPGETDSNGELPENGSPYQRQYMEAWYNETDRQLGGIFPSLHPAFPQVNQSNMNCTSLEPEDRWRYTFHNHGSDISQQDASTKCTEKGGYLASWDSQSEWFYFLADMEEQGATGNAWYSWAGGSDSAQEGVWKWAYSRPDRTNMIFWNGAQSGSAPKGAFSFWQSGEPNNDYLGEHGLAIRPKSDNWRWNDDDNQIQQYICEHAPLTPPATPVPQSGGGSTDNEEDAIFTALHAGGIKPPTTEERQNRTQGSSGGGINCTQVQLECQTESCPQAIFNSNNNTGDQCALALEWLIATRYNAALPTNSTERLPTNLTTREEWGNFEPDSNSSQVGSTGCPPGAYYCETCGDGCTSTCFRCDLTSCPSDAPLSINTLEGFCSCGSPTFTNALGDTTNSGNPTASMVLTQDQQWVSSYHRSASKTIPSDGGLVDSSDQSPRGSGSSSSRSSSHESQYSLPASPGGGRSSDHQYPISKDSSSSSASSLHYSWPSPPPRIASFQDGSSSSSTSPGGIPPAPPQPPQSAEDESTTSSHHFGSQSSEHRQPATSSSSDLSSNVPPPAVGQHSYSSSSTSEPPGPPFQPPTSSSARSSSSSTASDGLRSSLSARSQGSSTSTSSNGVEPPTPEVPPGSSPPSGFGGRDTRTRTVSLSPILADSPFNSAAAAAPDDGDSLIIGLSVGLGLLFLLLLLALLYFILRRVGYIKHSWFGVSDPTKYTKGFSVKDADPEAQELPALLLLKDQGGDAGAGSGGLGGEGRGRGEGSHIDGGRRAGSSALLNDPPGGGDIESDILHSDLLGGPRVFFDGLGDTADSAQMAYGSAAGKWRQTVSSEGHLNGDLDIYDTNTEGNSTQMKNALRGDVQSSLFANAAEEKKKLEDRMNPNRKTSTSAEDASLLDSDDDAFL